MTFVYILLGLYILCGLLLIAYLTVRYKFPKETLLVKILGITGIILCWPYVIYNLYKE